MIARYIIMLAIIPTPFNFYKRLMIVKGNNRNLKKRYISLNKEIN